MSWSRLAPLTGPLGLLTVIGALFTDHLPGGDAGDADIAAYFDQHGYAGALLMGLGVAVGGTLLLIFVASLAARVEDVDAGPVSRQLVRTTGTTWAGLTLLGGVLWASMPAAHMFDFAGQAPTASVYGYVGGMGYAVLTLACSLPAAVLAATLTGVALRTGLLPRWLAIAGVPASVLILANMMMPMLALTLWFTAVAVVLVRRTPVPVAAVAPEPAGLVA